MLVLPALPRRGQRASVTNTVGRWWMGRRWVIVWKRLCASPGAQVTLSLKALRKSAGYCRPVTVAVGSALNKVPADALVGQRSIVVRL